MCKKLLKIQSSLAIRLTGKSRCVESSRKSLFALLSEDFRLFPLSKLLGIESDYSLNHAEFVDIVLVWIGSNESSQRDVNTIWNRVRPDELAYHFLCHVRSTIQDLTNLSIPEVSPILSIGYEYYGYECKYESVKLNAVSELNSVRVKGECAKCCKQYSFKVNFVNKTPCYELKLNTRTCVKEIEGMCLVSHFSKDGIFTIFSLLTNYNITVKEKIRSHLESESLVYLRYLYKCSDLEDLDSAFS